MDVTIPDTLLNFASKKSYAKYVRSSTPLPYMIPTGRHRISLTKRRKPRILANLIRKQTPKGIKLTALMQQFVTSLKLGMLQST
jgi:hypothetical protein